MNTADAESIDGPLKQTEDGNTKVPKRDEIHEMDLQYFLNTLCAPRLFGIFALKILGNCVWQLGRMNGILPKRECFFGGFGSGRARTAQLKINSVRIRNCPQCIEKLGEVHLSLAGEKMYVPSADGILEMEIHQTLGVPENRVCDRLKLAEKMADVERQAEFRRRKFKKFFKLSDRLDEHPGFRLKRDPDVPLPGMVGQNAEFLAKPGKKRFRARIFRRIRSPGPERDAGTSQCFRQLDRPEIVCTAKSAFFGVRIQ